MTCSGCSSPAMWAEPPSWLAEGPAAGGGAGAGCWEVMTSTVVEGCEVVG